MPGTRGGCPASAIRSARGQDVPVTFRVAVFGAAFAAVLTRVVRFGAGVLVMVVLPAVRRVRGGVAAVFGAAFWTAAVIRAAPSGETLFPLARRNCSIMPGGSPSGPRRGGNR